MLIAVATLRHWGRKSCSDRQELAIVNLGLRVGPEGPTPSASMRQTGQSTNETEQTNHGNVTNMESKKGTETQSRIQSL